MTRLRRARRTAMVLLSEFDFAQACSCFFQPFRSGAVLNTCAKAAGPWYLRAAYTAEFALQPAFVPAFRRYSRSFLGVRVCLSLSAFSESGKPERARWY